MRRRYFDKRWFWVPGGELWFLPSGTVILWLGYRKHVLRRPRPTV